MKKLGLLLMPLMAISLLASCGTDNRKKYAVFFDTNGGSPEVERQIVKEGDYAKDPQIDVKRNGISLSYWSLQDEEEDNPTQFTFKDNKITSDITLHAIYPIDTNNPLAITCTKGPMSLCLCWRDTESSNQNIKWSTDKRKWTNIDITLKSGSGFEKIVDLNTNDTVYLAGDNPNGFSGFRRYISISNNVDDKDSEFEISGNPLSLIDSANYASITEMPPYCFHSLFACSNITSAKELNLSCTKLSIDCCRSMFEYCEKLVEAPTILPAMELAPFCYKDMFADCEKLIRAPELPVALFNDEYINCYSQMFYSCSSLAYVKVGFGANNEWPVVEGSCDTMGWLTNVAPNGTFVWNGSTDKETLKNAGLLDERGSGEYIDYIPADWTVENPSSVSNR